MEFARREWCVGISRIDITQSHGRLGTAAFLHFVNTEPNETSMYGNCEILCGCKGISLTCATTRAFSERYACFANDTRIMRTLTDSTRTITMQS